MVAVIGRTKETTNYVNKLNYLSIENTVTLNPEFVLGADAVLFPGGGDINPKYYNEEMNGSDPSDDELDSIQLKALDLAVKNNKPIMGICRGMQLINIYFGGSLIQHMDKWQTHRADETGDKYHLSVIEPGNFLYDIYGSSATINSSHHQCVKVLGKGLKIIQRASDGTPEGYIHESLPIFGLQWHPERLDEKRAGISSDPIFQYFLSLAK